MTFGRFSLWEYYLWRLLALTVVFYSFYVYRSGFQKKETIDLPVARDFSTLELFVLCAWFSVSVIMLMVINQQNEQKDSCPFTDLF